MRLVVKQGGRTINEFKADKGPVYIGRRSASQIPLPDKAVSKQHALISVTDDGKWMVEDLDSANKTYLNERAIQKAEIKTGDILRIVDFTIEVDLETAAAAAKPDVTEEAPFSKTDVFKLELAKPDVAQQMLPKVDTTKLDLGKPDAGKTAAGKTAAGKTAAGKTDVGKTIASKLSAFKPVTTMAARDQQIIIRKPGAEKAPPITLPAERAVDFLQATEEISKAGGIDNVLLVLLALIEKQFRTCHVWCALRNEPAGPMTCHAGKQRDGQPVQLSDLKLSEKINQAIDEGEFMLFIFSRAPGQSEHGQVRSVLIAPVLSPAGCFGALYADNAIGEEHYSLSDLDYLMFLAVHTATVLANL